MPDAPRAVFLSYASQDAEAAKRIAEALRAAGIEVWFDVEGGLETGDEWDAKIRRQIKECVLFIPLISANTQAREEGYFRIEWDLAAERARGIASGVAFILPIMIDDTREPAALVPDRFRSVQWTRARNGELTPEARAKFAKLWSHRAGLAKHRAGETAAPAAAPDHVGPSLTSAASPPRPRRISPVAWAVALVLVAGLAFGAWYFAARPRAAAPVASAPANAREAKRADEFPRDPELRRARALLFTMDAILEDFRLAEDIIQPIVAQRPNDPEVATVAAEVALEFLVRGFDLAPPRRAQVQRLTERAAQLAPENPYAIAAVGRYLLFIDAQLNRAEELTRRAIALRPDEARFHRTLYAILARTKPRAEVDAYGDRMAAQFPRDALVAYDIARRYKDANDLVEAEKWFERTVSHESPPTFAFVWKAWLMLQVHGDLAGMKQSLDRISERQRGVSRVANAHYVHALYSGETAHALRALDQVGEPWLTDFDFTGPKALLIGNLHLTSGRADLANVQLEAALSLANAEIEKNPTDLFPRRAKMWALISLGRLEEARGIYQLLLQATRRPYVLNFRNLSWTNTITCALLLGYRADALALLREAAGADANTRLVLRNLFKLDPRLAPWRDDPEIMALLAEPSAAAPANSPAPAALSPARELTMKALELIRATDATRGDFALAEDFCQRALKLDSTDGEVWAAASQVHSAFVYRGWDTTPERREQTRTMAERAMRLAPSSPDAKVAQAGAWSSFGINRAETEKLLREVVAERPNDQPSLRFLAVTVLANGKFEECLALNERSAALPGGDPLALFNNARYLWQRGRVDEAFAMLERSLAQKPTNSALVLKALMEVYRRGDLAAAEAALRRIPQSSLLEDRANFTAGLVAYYRRDAAAALQAWSSFPREHYADFQFDGPKGLLVGLAYELDGRDAAARIEWRAALQVAERRLAAAPNLPTRHFDKAHLHACLGENAAAEESLRAYEQLAGIKLAPGTPMTFEVALIHVRLGRLDEIFAHFPSGALPRLRLDPRMEAVRADPRFAPYCATSTPAGAAIAATAPNEKSVAVLAFANLSSDKEQEYFSDGISEELLNVLAKVPGLKVSARTSAFHFKGKNTPIPEIAKQLGVAYVVEGSVRKSGDKVRITAQLIKAADGFHVWSETFTRDIKDVFAVQDEIAGLVAQNLSLKLGTSSSRKVAAVSPQAFEHYVQARQSWSLRTPEGFARAEQMLNRALELAPDFIRARAALIDVVQMRSLRERRVGNFGQRHSPEIDQRLAQVREVLALDPDLAEAYSTLGQTLDSKWLRDEAGQAYRRATELNPNYATGRQWYGMHLAELGYMDEALAELKAACDLDPFSFIILDNYGWLLHLAGRTSEALQMLDRAAALNPGFDQTSRVRAVALKALGRTAEAETIARRLRNNQRELDVWTLGTVGLPAEAKALLTQMDPRDVTNRFQALLSAGEREAALEALADPSGASKGDSIDILYQPIFDPIRTDPRFIGYLSVLKLTEAHHRAQTWRRLQSPGQPEAKP